MTFIVVSDFEENARLLSTEHIVKQRVEAKQILDALQRGTGWKHHPITRAWAGFEDCLKYYYNCIVHEFIRRGGNNTMPYFDIPKVILRPWWTSWNPLHQSHRAMLIRKNPYFYRTQFTVESKYWGYGYIWTANFAYEDRNLPLAEITAPIPPELVNPVYCPAILKSGERRGQPCHRLVKDSHKGSQVCNIHRR